MIQAGTYLTRDGRTVTVSERRDRGSFPVAGYVHEWYRGMMRPRGYRRWMPTGRFLPLKEHPLDLVQKL